MTRNQYATQGRLLIAALKRKEADIPVARLREVFSYDAEAGQLLWAVNKGTQAPAGSIAGSVSNGYRRVQLDGVSTMAHRICWALWHSEWPKGLIDHIDGNRSNNRILNLREGSYAMNRENQRKPRADSASGVLGACWHKSTKKWKASIQVNGKHIHIGLFASAEAAGAAYLAKKREIHAGCTI